MKSLVVYSSRTGNTEKVVQKNRSSSSQESVFQRGRERQKEGFKQGFQVLFRQSLFLKHILCEDLYKKLKSLLQSNVRELLAGPEEQLSQGPFIRLDAVQVRQHYVACEHDRHPRSHRVVPDCRAFYKIR